MQPRSCRRRPGQAALTQREHTVFYFTGKIDGVPAISSHRPNDALALARAAFRPSSRRWMSTADHRLSTAHNPFFGCPAT
jgi:hypothetical protein